MRSDWPVISEEDYVEPPCEIFLQLFIQNVEMAMDDSPDDNNDDYDLSIMEQLNEHDTDEFIEDFSPIFIEDVSDSDDSDIVGIPLSMSSCPVIHPELSPFWSEEEESESELHAEESNDDEPSILNSFSDMSQFSIGSASHNESEQQEELLQESGGAELMTDVHPRNEYEDSEVTDIHSKAEISVESAHSNVKNCGDSTSSNDASLSNDLLKISELPIGFETSPDISNVQPSTHVSLYVVVPPTNFPNETGRNLLPEISRDSSSFISANASINLSTPCTSENEQFQSDAIAVQNCTKIPNLTTSVKSALQENAESKQTFNILNSPVDNSFSNSKSEITNCVIDKESELLFDSAIHSEETTIENNSINSEISDKSVSSLKRKVNSVDDNILSKVSRYSSQISNDSINQGSLDYSRDLANNLDNFHEDDKIAVASSESSGDSMLQTLGKSVDHISVIKEITKS